MNNKYIFQLQVWQSGTLRAEQEIHPNYPANLSLNWEKESGEAFLRRKLSGKLTIYGSEYDWLLENLTLSRSATVIMKRQQGAVTDELWRGEFWLTDCEVDADSRTVEVTPTPIDEYSAILKKISAEYDILKLGPEIRRVRFAKRPVVQIYTAGRTVIGCALGGMYWETDCDSESSDRKLRETYHFKRNVNFRTITAVTNAGTEQAFVGDTPVSPTQNYTLYEAAGADMILTMEHTFDQYENKYRYSILSNGVVTYTGVKYNSDPPQNMVLNGASASTQGLTVTISTVDTGIYMRILTDSETLNGESTYPIPATDLVENNRNYKRCMPLEYPDAIVISHLLQSSPTKWGMYKPGRYYINPQAGGKILVPVARTTWGRMSVWFQVNDATLLAMEEALRQNYYLRNAYPLAAVLKVLLKETTGTAVSIEETTEYSAILFGSNPIAYGISAKPVIAPKSNVINSNYDQPAQSAKVSLRTIFDMLKKVYRIYWWIDSAGRLRLEHIKYINNGGSYSAQAGIGLDLRNYRNPRNGRNWQYGQKQWSYDKPDTVGRYQFGWMDSVSEPFEGYPIEILNPWVDDSNIDEVTVDQFTSDFDFILISPQEISKDGFVLMQPIEQGEDYVLPFETIQVGSSTFTIQNAYCANIYTLVYYLWDLDAPDFRYNGVNRNAYAVKKLRRQKVKFPYKEGFDINKLITTDLGNGKIEKISLDLSSLNTEVELLYDTE